MQKIVSLHPIENFTPPDDPRGTPTNKSPVLLGQLPPGDTHTILYYINKDNPSGPQPQDPTTDPQYSLWQAGINSWLSAGGTTNIYP